jgi:hypothetical protein
VAVATPGEGVTTVGSAAVGLATAGVGEAGTGVGAAVGVASREAVQAREESIRRVKAQVRMDFLIRAPFIPGLYHCRARRAAKRRSRMAPLGAPEVCCARGREECPLSESPGIRGRNASGIGSGK